MLNLSLGCRIIFGSRNTFTKIVLIPLNRNVQTKRLHVDSIVNQEIRNWSVIFQHRYPPLQPHLFYRRKIRLTRRRKIFSFDLLPRSIDNVFLSLAS